MQQAVRVGILGCGVVGAAIAYELSQVPGLAITVLDRRSPDQWEATGAALGVLMAALSQKKGGSLSRRLASLQRYETLVPELEARTGYKIPYNRQGILYLCFDQAELMRWQATASLRASQGFLLKIIDLAELRTHYPALSHARALDTAQPLVGAVHSTADRQIDPVRLTTALVKAAQDQGVIFNFQTAVQGFRQTTAAPRQVKSIQTQQTELAVDWLVLASGLGSTLLSTELQQPVDVRPVLGQALHLQLPQPLAAPDWPVISGLDVHLVPVSSREFWVGATVEFPDHYPDGVIQPDAQRLAALRQQAIAFCPALADATVTRTWSGLRPRPENRPAPIVERLDNYSNVLLATGHYRNGVLLAPITAEKIRQMISTHL
ncbi:D-amino acid dehydrogenase [uncultured Synechococcales cyanobacterium]|uniref:D-amino acid dehydrogenase n=1 Tax=uncultured Synechococcales cyanobacterium TaxID=1936017 RepID=A0A6J4VFY9_9CYAN|nr:D-amino acid dehydrogenase [uncultured Synechococcales cyanobacterium]